MNRLQYWIELKQCHIILQNIFLLEILSKNLGCLFDCLQINQIKESKRLARFLMSSNPKFAPWYLTVLVVELGEPQQGYGRPDRYTGSNEPVPPRYGSNEPRRPPPYGSNEPRRPPPYGSNEPRRPPPYGSNEPRPGYPSNERRPGIDFTKILRAAFGTKVFGLFLCA